MATTATKTKKKPQVKSARKFLEACTFITEEETGLIKSFFFEFTSKSDTEAEWHVTVHNEGTREYDELVFTAEFRGKITEFLSSITIPFTFENAPAGIENYSCVEIFKFDDKIDHADLVAEAEHNLPRIRFEVSERA